jgi:hypothetical protein
MKTLCLLAVVLTAPLIGCAQYHHGRHAHTAVVSHGPLLYPNNGIPPVNVAVAHGLAHGYYRPTYGHYHAPPPVFIQPQPVYVPPPTVMHFYPPAPAPVRVVEPRPAPACPPPEPKPQPRPQHSCECGKHHHSEVVTARW